MKLNCIYLLCLSTIFCTSVLGSQKSQLGVQLGNYYLRSNASVANVLEDAIPWSWPWRSGRTLFLAPNKNFSKIWGTVQYSKITFLNWYFVHSFWVHPDKRNSKFGSKLKDGLLKTLMREDCGKKTIFCTVDPFIVADSGARQGTDGNGRCTEALVAIYSKWGFKRAPWYLKLSVRCLDFLSGSQAGLRWADEIMVSYPTAAQRREGSAA